MTTRCTTSLLQAISDNRLADTLSLLQSGADPNQTDPGFYDGIPPLGLAVKRGCAWSVSALIRAGADKASLSDLFISAVARGKTHEKVVLVLVENGANVRASSGDPSDNAEVRDYHDQISDELYLFLVDRGATPLPKSQHLRKVRNSLLALSRKQTPAILSGGLKRGQGGRR